MNLRQMTLLVLAAPLAAVIACSGQPSTQASAPPQPATTSEAPSQPADANTFVGTVVETMDSGPYTYVRVEAGGQEIWAATNRFEVAVGDRVIVPADMPMENFHSDTLDRDFDTIYFAGRIAHEGETLPPAMPAGHPPVSGAAAAHGSAQPQPVTVEPAPGGMTIAEIWAGKSRLADATITVRGQVVKFNGGILGTNWIHLQDGSGDPAAGTHDITVTTPANVAVGDVVTATGTLALDQDFGAGYTYPALIKDAAVVQK